MQRIALVSVANRDRAVLAQYLRDSGFDVHVCEELAITGVFGALILLGNDMPSEELRARVRRWMKAKTQVIVVTSRPTALEELKVTHGKRLIVFAPPVFGWDVVDALRASEPPRPRSA